MLNKQLKIIISTIIILILVALNLTIFISFNKENDNESKQTSINQGEQINEYDEGDEETTIEGSVDNKITTLSDGERMKAYFGKFVEAIEEQEYEVAYSYLNEEFKKNFFPSLEDFSQYIKTEIPYEDIVVKYSNIERKGEIFVLSVSLHDADNLIDTQKIRSVVIRENQYNDFTISFSK